ncbi:MAG: HAD-IA family hydrolase [Deltaproteobacteria bacterium]|nr:HAD-IA family hydrolase [Deltaproteobacteria bacterium]
MEMRKVPFKDIDTVFIDAGNTLLSMDYPWIKEELEKLGIGCEIDELKKAEAAARPVLSSAIEKLKSTEDRDASFFYMGSILKKLPATSGMKDHKRDEIIRALVTSLQAPGRLKRFWANLIPGVRQALEILKHRGIRLSVVSNSNGMIEEIISVLNIRGYFIHVFDSHVIGYEKPDKRLFSHALKTLGAAPESTVHIGDLYHVDVLGAWSAGIHALLLDPYDDWKDVDCERMPDLLSFARVMENI